MREMWEEGEEEEVKRTGRSRERKKREMCEEGGGREGEEEKVKRTGRSRKRGKRGMWEEGEGRGSETNRAA